MQTHVFRHSKHCMCVFVDKESAEQLSTQVNEAMALLTEYNNRLSTEMECRKKVATMLRDFTQAQKELLAQAEQRLEVLITNHITDLCGIRLRLTFVTAE